MNRDDEDEYEESGGGNQLFGFMFGNVDNSGDLDADYLDEDAKEHLAALADKLGSSLTDIDLSAKSPKTTTDAAEQDYDEKAEDAVDYEDIDEQYEGPEIQALYEEDHLLPKKDFFPSEIPFASMQHTTSVFDNENYDEDEDIEKEDKVGGNVIAAETTILSDKKVDQLGVVSQSREDDQEREHYSLEYDDMEADLTDFHKDVEVPQEPVYEKSSAPLPVLCVEDGMVILRFSEIFCMNEPPKKVKRKDRRYSVSKDRYTSMDVSNIIEEDEEAFLRGSFKTFSTIKQIQTTRDDISLFIDGDSESEKYDVIKREEKFDSCLNAEPMKKNATFSLFLERGSPKFDPIDQQDWENMIIWDDESRVMSESSVESGETSEAESESLVNKEMESESGSQSHEFRVLTDSEQKDHDLCLHSVLVEPIGSTYSLDVQYTERRHHPQLLRLESRLDPDNAVAEECWQSDALKRLNKAAPRNKNIIEGSWLNNIIWDSNKPILRPKLILDLQDEQMLFEILDDAEKDGEDLRLHAGAMIISRSSKSSNGDSVELPGGHAGGLFNIANDKFYSKRKISQQLKSHSKKRTAHGIKVLHSIPALKLQTMKMKLSNKEISNFHRPKALWYPHDIEVVMKEQGKLSTQGSMKIILKSLGGKGCKLHVDTEEPVSSIKAKASKKLDFRPTEPVKIFYCGKELEDDKNLSVQNVRPNALLHLVRTKVYLLPRAQKLPGENKSLRPPGAFKKKADLSAKDGHVFLMEYCEERPLLLGNVGMGARLCTYYQKSSASDQTGNTLRSENNSLGSVHVLDPADKSPFLGDIKPGCKQSSLETNMFRAPIFPHKVSSTDYLLVRSAKGKLSIRRIDRVDVVGQQEPHLEVMSPGGKGLQTYIMNRLMVFMYREFRAFEQRGSRPCIRADQLSSYFPFLSEAFLRKRLKHFADLQRKTNGDWFWIMKRNFRIPLEEELRRMVTPEHVCAYESMLAGQCRLRNLGISRLTLPTSISSAMNQLPDEAIALAAASHIERELLITPWNLSSNFVACTNQDRDNIERLEITGVGDPSGRGLGFSYVKIAPKAPVSNAMVKKKAAVSRVSTTVTGTDADLRRLSMEAAREVLLKFNVPEEQISKLTRWHRIAMIRKLSSEQAASGVKVDPTTINKYARGQRMSFLQLQQQTREKCQEIWDRQIQNLSPADGDEIESDSEVHSDLDSFAGDLENLLDAEEFDEEGDGFDNLKSKDEKVVGVRGLKMRRHPSQAQAKEEIEDEEAEAAELFRILMDDDVGERKKKKKKMKGMEEPRLTPGSQLGFGNENGECVKNTSLAMQQNTNVPQLDGVYASKEINIGSKEAENFNFNQNFSGKFKTLKKTDLTVWGSYNKKVKILGDGGVQMIKEKKSAREKFVCGACGQLGHMKTNKNCPRYREDPLDPADPNKVLGRSSSMDPTSQPMHKTTVKKLAPKNTPKITLVDSMDGEKPNIPKPKTLKFKCGPTELPSTSNTDTGIKPVVKVNKIIISNKPKLEEDQGESHKPSIIIKPPTFPENDRVESQRPSIFIRPPSDIDKDQSAKKIIIKRPKEIIKPESVNYDISPSFEYRKTKKITELSSFEGSSRRQESKQISEDFGKRKSREEKIWWEEEEKRRNVNRVREERERRIYEENIRMQEGRGRLNELKRYEEEIRREREEEEIQKAKKKKNKKKIEIKDEYFEDSYMTTRNDRRMPERDRNAKRRQITESGPYAADYGPPTKRRRGGEVGLSNILENIVDILKKRHEVSALFQKPVSKKEAPDYLDIIDTPMDLSTIRQKVRKLEYKNREDFRHDVCQITINAHTYNDGRYPAIPPLADQLLEICDFVLDQNDEALTEAENSIKQNGYF